MIHLSNIPVEHFEKVFSVSNLQRTAELLARSNVEMRYERINGFSTRYTTIKDNLIECMRQVCLRFGIPEIMISED